MSDDYNLMLDQIYDKHGFMINPKDVLHDLNRTKILEKQLVETKTCIENTVAVENNLHKQVEELQQRLTGSFKRESNQQKRIEELKHTRFKRFNNEECWIYNLGEDNFVYSLVCPVVISADDIREIEKQLAESVHKSKLTALLQNETETGFPDSRKDIIKNLKKLLKDGG